MTSGYVRTFSTAAGMLLVPALPLLAQPPEPAPAGVPGIVTTTQEVLVVPGVPPGTVHVAQTPKPATKPPSREPPVRVYSTPNHQGFSVVLVLADIKGDVSSAEDNVPPAARRALDDMKDFLPYKSYRLLDAAWLLGQGTQTIRLRGVEGQEYELRLTTPVYAHSSMSRDRLSVQFSLRDVQAQEEAVQTALLAETVRSRAQHAERLAEMDRLTRELSEARKQSDEEKAREIEKRISTVQASMSRTDSNLRRASASARTIIDTNFTMEVGETVVVGTSRLKNNTGALIALLTAVPPRSPSSNRETR